MSYHASDYPDVGQQSFERKRSWIIMGGFLLLLVIGVVVLNYVGMRNASEIGGGVTIEADSDTRIYIGNKQVGTTQVHLTWEELFCDEKHKPIAVELPSPSSAVTAELVSGPGAVELDSQEAWGLGGSGAGSVKMKDSGFKYLIRRQNGELDQVIAIVIDWVPDAEPVRRYLLPVRLRKGPIPSMAYFDGSCSQSSSRGDPGFMIALGLSRNEIIRKWSFSAKRPPNKLEEEIRTKGLWEPEAK